MTAHAAAACRNWDCRMWCSVGPPGIPVPPPWLTPIPRPPNRLPRGLFAGLPDHRARSGAAAFADSDAWFLIRVVTPPDPDTLPQAP